MADGFVKAEPPHPWKKLLLRGTKGGFLSNVENAAIALENAPDLQGMLAYNELTRSTVLLRPVPESGHPWGGERTALKDTHEIAILQWIQRHAISSMALSSVISAVASVALNNSFHPFRDYLNSLKWDRTKRLDTWMIDCMGAQDTPYNRAVGRMFIIAIVARTKRPGCKCDYMPVFEGRQGTRKSMALRILASDEYFSDAIPDLAHNAKDVSIHLRGKIIIEFSDLAALGRAEIAAIKKFLTQQEEKFRPPYGRNEVVEPRQCVFTGTTNDDKYLKDDTGARRFWPVATSVINIDLLVEIRDQLYAEACVAYSKGEPYWPDEKFETEHFKPEQDARQEENSLIDVLEPWLKTLKDGEEITMTQAAQMVSINLTADRLGPFLQRKFGVALSALGWVRGPRSGGPTRWVRAEAASKPRPYHKTRRPKW